MKDASDKGGRAVSISDAIVRELNGARVLLSRDNYFGTWISLNSAASLIEALPAHRRKPRAKRIRNIMDEVDYHYQRNRYA